MFLEFSNLFLCHLIFRIVKYLLWEHFQNWEVILADIHIFEGSRANIVNKCGPCGIPFVFDNLNEDRIGFREDVMQSFRDIFDRPVLEDNVNYIGLETISLFLGKGKPFLLNIDIYTLIASSKITKVNTLV